MLEHHKERFDFICDLTLRYFSDAEPEKHGIRESLKLSSAGANLGPTYFPDTMAIDFDSDWAEDRPGFLATADSMIGEIVYPRGISLEWEPASQQLTGINKDAKPGELEWYWFGVVSIQVDVEFYWDFDDEAGMDRYDSLIKEPFFYSLQVELPGFALTYSSLDLVECVAV